MALPAEYPSMRATRHIETPVVQWTGAPLLLPLITELGGQIELRGERSIGSSAKVTARIRRRAGEGQWQYLPDVRRAEFERRPLDGDADDRVIAKFRGIPAGTYLVRTQVTGYEPESRELDVRPGHVTTASFRQGNAVPTLNLAFEGYANGSRFTFTRWDELITQDVASGTVPDAGSVKLEGLRRGHYLLLFWSSHEGHSVEVGDTRSPPPLVRRLPPLPGPRTLTVDLRHDGAPVGAPLIALFPGAGPQVESGEQFWFRDADSRGARFEGLAPGQYRLAVYDGVYGQLAGFFDSPKIVQMEIESEDKRVQVDLP